MKKACDRCAEEFEYLYLTIEGDVCLDCMSDIDDEQFEKDIEED